MAEVPVHLQKYVFKEGNQAAKGKRKSMKQYAREYLNKLNDQERIAFLNSIDPDKVWRMAEGNPPDSIDMTTGGKPFRPPIYAGLSRHHIGKKDIRPKEKDTSGERRNGGEQDC